MFNLHSLGWNSFQQLCHTIVRDVLGQTVESFLDSNDGGRDGAFTGQWAQSGSESLAGVFVVQCKFTNRAGYSLHLSDISEELPKIRRLVDGGRCDTYLLLTNAGISGRSSETIEASIRSVGVKHVRILGSSWIEQQIRESRTLRMLVPRVYGLGDLSQILDSRAYAQARALFESMKEDLAKVVVTASYQRAANALNDHRFVLLLGDPASGKSTIASMLCLAAADRWGVSVVKADTPREVIEHWNPDDPEQLFWVDDAFGAVQYEESLVNAWNQRLPQIKALLVL